MDAALEKLIDRVRSAVVARTPLRIRAGGTKDFYGNTPRGDVLDPRELDGIITYDPAELQITARAGTRLSEIEAALEAQGQMLAFEPPHFGPDATIGGCVAAGLAGPRRAAAGYAYGSVRDFLLGAQLLDGHGRVLTFGGTVIKNVAGYDMARVLAGSLGILGVILQVSIKVLPRPAMETTLQLELDETSALSRLNEWGGQPLPLSASAWSQGVLSLRISGAASAVRSACSHLGGEELAQPRATGFWRDLREHSAPLFQGSAPLWRLSLPCTAPPIGGQTTLLMEWGGAQRWFHSDLPAAEIRARALALGGHATLFRGDRTRTDAFTPLSAPLAAIHRRLKAEFDPHGIFNPGRMYADL